MGITIHFLTYCSTEEFWWEDVNFVPRIGEEVWHLTLNDYYFVKEVRYQSSGFAIITLDKYEDYTPEDDD